MLLAECKHTLVHPLYLCEHIYAVSIVGAIIWIPDSEAAGFVPPCKTAHVRPVHQHDPVVGVTIADLVEMIGPFMAFQYARACGVYEGSI